MPLVAGLKAWIIDRLKKATSLAGNRCEELMTSLL
jgi:hypothetical protein